MHKRMKQVLAAFFAVALSLFAVAGVAKAEPKAPSSITDVNDIVADGMTAVNQKINGSNPYGVISANTQGWQSSNNNSSGSAAKFTCTITNGKVLVSQVKDDIIGILVKKLGASGITTIEGYSVTNGSMSQNATELKAENGAFSQPAITSFIKACLPGVTGQYGLQDLNGKSCYVEVPVSNTSAWYKLTFAYSPSNPGGGGGEQPAPPTPGDIAGGTVSDETQSNIENAVVNSGLGTIEEPTTATDPTTNNETVTWTVNVDNNDVSVDQVNNAVVKNVLDSIQKAVSTTNVKSAVASSVDNPQITLDILHADSTAIERFGLQCLNAAQASSVSNQATTSGDLVNKTAKIRVVATGQNDSKSTVDYNIVFVGEATPPAPAGTVTITRLYNPNDKQFLWTSDPVEIAACKRAGWSQDTAAATWNAPVEQPEGGYLIVRYYNPATGDHYYVKDSDTAQKAFIEANGWVPDSTKASFYSAAPTEENVEVYTLFNPTYTPQMPNSTHLYTPDQYEAGVLCGANGSWVYNTSIIWGVPDSQAS